MHSRAILVVGALVALGQAKAVVTNNCHNHVYIWSVPDQPGLANNLPIGPGARYEEPWRPGTLGTPGIAIKVSTESNGIYAARDEIDFEYSIATSSPSYIWINLANIRGNTFSRAVLHTCHSVIERPVGSTEQCSTIDDVELTLCGSERTVPAHDTTPAHVISDCIGRVAEREDDSPYSHACSGRVVSPIRKGSTLPLKTVMRLDAAKHAQEAPNYALIPVNNVFLGNFTKGRPPKHVHVVKRDKHVSAYRTFDTAVLVTEKRENFCTSDSDDSDSWCEISDGEYKLPTPGKDMHVKPKPSIHNLVSQGLSEQRKRFVPAPTPNPADDTVTAHHLNDVRNVCIVVANEKLGKYFGADVTEHLVTSIFPHTRWTDNLDDCSPRAITASRDYHHKLIDKKQGKTTKCLHELSYHADSSGDPVWHVVWPCEGKVCKRLRKDLNSLSRDVGERWAWSDDKDGCLAQAYFGENTPPVCKDLLGPETIGNLYGYWGEMYGDILRRMYPDIPLSDLETSCSDAELGPSKRWYHNDRIKKPRIRRCVNPYCTPFGRDCSDVEDDLEDFSQKVGHNTDWTSEDEVCQEDEVYMHPHLVLGRHMKKKEDTCIKEICEDLVSSDKTCEDKVKFFQEMLQVVSGATFNGSFCHTIGGNQTIPVFDSVKKERSEPILCKKDFCRRSNHIEHDCEKIQHDFQAFVNKTMQLSAVEFTDDNELCAPSVAYGPDSRRSPIRLRASPRSQTNGNFRILRHDENRDRPQMQVSLCAENACQHPDNQLNGSECLHAMEMVSFDIFGLHFEFDDDPDLCHSADGIIKICGKAFCDLIDHDCEQGKDLFRNYMDTIMATAIEFADSKEVCGPVLARAAFGDPAQFRRSLPLGCAKVYCAPRIPGVDCGTLERDFSRVTANISSGAHACIDDPLLYRAPMYDQQGHQLLCMKDFCSFLKHGVDCEQTFPHIRRYYKDIHSVDIEPTLIESTCGHVPSDFYGY